MLILFKVLLALLILGFGLWVARVVTRSRASKAALDWTPKPDNVEDHIADAKAAKRGVRNELTRMDREQKSLDRSRTRAQEFLSDES